MIRSTLSVDEMTCSAMTQVELDGSRLAYGADFATGVYKLISKNGVPVWQRLFLGETMNRLKQSVEGQKSIRRLRYAEFLAEARR